MSRHKRTVAVSISTATKRAVNRRDGGKCIFCGRYGDPVAHVVSRAQGGLGVEQNIVTACWECHMAMDNSPARRVMVQEAINYLTRCYGSWSKEEVTYNKWKSV